MTIGANLAGLNQGLMQAQGKLKSVGQRMGSLGRTLSMAVTAPLIGIGVASVKMAADFEQQMALAQLALRDTGVSMETVSDYALKMGADTIYNAQEMALALTGLGKAGLNWEEIAGDMTGATGVLAAVTNLAAASDLELAQAADAVAVAMATFGRPADDAVDIVDNLVMAADASVASVGDLAAGLASAGPIMASFGWSLEDTTTALALLSERGIRGSEAGTALRSMMTNLMRPTDQVKDALGLLNVNLYDSENRLKALPELVGELSQALTIGAERTSKMSSLTGIEEKELKRLQGRHDSLRNSISDYQMGVRGATWTEEKRREKVAELQEQLTNLERAMSPLIATSQEYTTVTQELTEEQRNQLIQTLAGTYGMRAMTTLLEEGTEGWEGMTDAIAEGATAQEVANILTDSLKGKLEELRGGVETLAIKFGGVLSPVLQELVEQRLIPLVNVLSELDEEQMAGLAKLGLVLAGIGPGLIVLGGLTKLLPVLVSPLGLLAIGATILGAAWYMTTDKGIKLRSALRGLSGDLKKQEGTRALGEMIDKFANFLDKLEVLWERIERLRNKITTFVEPLVAAPAAPAVPGMPTTEEVWAQYAAEPEMIKGWHELLASIPQILGGVVMDFVMNLVGPDAEETPQEYVDRVESELGLLSVFAELILQPDMDEIEASGREAGRRWKRAFDSATGGTTGGSGGAGGGIMDELRAGGIPW